MLKRIDDKKILYIVSIVMLTFVQLLKMISFYLYDYSYIDNYDKINPSYILIASIPFLIFTYIRTLKRKNFKLDKYDYIFLIMTIAGIITCIFSINKQVSIMGKSYRHEGFLSVLSYNLLFINWKNLATKKDLSILYKIIMWITIINTVYGLFQVYTDFPFIIRGGADDSMSGLCGHNNFFGSLVVTSLSMLTCKILIDKKFNIKDLVVFILLVIGLINCQSTGPILAYIITVIFLVIFLIIKKNLNIKKFLVVFILPVILLILVYSINIFVFKSGNCELCDIKNKTINNGGNYRIYIWKASFEVANRHLITGVGYDNLVYDYPANPKIEDNFDTITQGFISLIPKAYYMVDNAHNVYLHILASLGLIGFIPYMLLCLLIFISGLKSKEPTNFIILGGFVAYAIQAFVNLSVIQVAPIFYVLMGLLASNKK